MLVKEAPREQWAKQPVAAYITQQLCEDISRHNYHYYTIHELFQLFAFDYFEHIKPELLKHCKALVLNQCQDETPASIKKVLILIYHQNDSQIYWNLILFTSWSFKDTSPQTEVMAQCLTVNKSFYEPLVCKVYIYIYIYNIKPQ